MTSNYPNSMAMDFTHMYDIKDLRGKFPKQKPCPGSIWDMISTDPRFTMLKFIVERAGMQGFYDDPLAGYTLLVPTDDFLSSQENIIMNMDTMTCRKVLLNSTVKKRLPSTILKDSPMFHLYTMPSGYSTERLTIQNLGGETVINGKIRVLEWDLILRNGIVHLVDSLLVPYIF